VSWLIKNCPDSELHIQSCLPTSFESGLFADCQQTNRDVVRFNEFLKQQASELCIDYIDLHACFELSGCLNSDFSEDGVHLNEKGYQIWASKIEHVLNTILSTR
jgi:hypothetical protein